MINSRFGNKKGGDDSFPTLMVAGDGDIVLFTEYEAGVIVYSGNSSFPVGYYSSSWQMDQFEYFNGDVVISNP
tara:strand:- start:24705 stop:24923 length:219 start_codon:yes stop_codon:yes gene_type:complete